MDYIAKNKDDMEKENKTYLALVVPVDKRTQWFEDMKRKIPNKEYWDGDGSEGNIFYYHITLAYLYKVPPFLDINHVISEVVKKYSNFSLTFDCVDAFTARNLPKHIIHLGIKQIPVGFLEFITDIRETLMQHGCVMDPGFKLHATLGKVPKNIKLYKIRTSLSQINVKQPIEFATLKYCKGGSAIDAPSIAEFEFGKGLIKK